MTIDRNFIDVVNNTGLSNDSEVYYVDMDGKWHRLSVCDFKIESRLDNYLKITVSTERVKLVDNGQ